MFEEMEKASWLKKDLKWTLMNKQDFFYEQLKLCIAIMCETFARHGGRLSKCLCPQSMYGILIFIYVFVSSLYRNP